MSRRLSQNSTPGGRICFPFTQSFYLSAPPIFRPMSAYSRGGPAVQAELVYNQFFQVANRRRPQIYFIRTCLFMLTLTIFVFS